MRTANLREISSPQEKPMNAFRMLLAMFGLAAGMAVAQPPLVESESRAARVQAILDTAQEKVRNAREQIGPPVDETSRIIFYAAMEAIRADTEDKLSHILNEEEVAAVLVRARFPATPARFEALRFRKV
jgi:hypothetical protein